MRLLRTLIVVFGPGLAASGLQAESVAIGGIQWELPSGWRRDGESWRLESESAPALRLVAAVIPGSMPIASAVELGPEAALEREMRSRGFERPRVKESRLLRIGGAQAWRMRMTGEVEGRRITQVLLVVEALETVAFTFTCDAEEFERARPEMEIAVERIVILDGKGAEESPASLCGALLGVLAGASCASWRRGRRQAAVQRSWNSN